MDNAERIDAKTYVYMDNYRGFSDTIVPLRRVNFLVGENSTGKSSFLDLIKLFYEFQFWFFEPSFRFSKVEQRHFLDIVSASSEKKDSFSIGAMQISRTSKKSSKGMIVTYQNVDWRPAPIRVTIIEQSKIKTIDISGKKNIKDGYEARSIKEFSEADENDSLERVARKYVDLHSSNDGMMQREVSSELSKAPFLMKFSDFLFEGGAVENRESYTPDIFQGLFCDMAPIRTKPRRTYDAPQTEFSPEGQHTPYLLKRRLASKKSGDAFRSYLKKIGASSGLFDALGVKQYGDDPLAPFEVKIDLGDASLGLQNVGYGVSQAIPVLVEVFVRPRGTAFAIQQPEVHLHPRAQAAIGDVIADLARDEEKIFFVETHSDFTIDRFRLNLRKKSDENDRDAENANDQAIDGARENPGSYCKNTFSQILFFERGEGGNYAIPIEIHQDGALSDDQPETYRSFFLNESLALL